jgi:hypothetical protein
LFDAFVLSLLFGSFVFYYPNRVDGDELWSLYALGLIAVLSFFFKRERTVDLKLIGVVLVTAMVSTLLNPANFAKASFANMFMACFSIKVMAERIKFTNKHFGVFLFAAHVVGLVFVYWQMTGQDMIYIPWATKEVSGTFIMPWAMGCFAALSIPFLYILSPWLCLIAAPALYLSHSSICVISAAIMFILMIPKHSRSIFLAGIALALAYVCFVDPSIDVARFEVIGRSAKYIHNFIFGNGIGSWAHEGFLKLNGQDAYYWRFAHNEFYQHFFEAGIVGLIPALVAIAAMLNKKSRAIVAAVIGIAILSTFHSMFHYGRLAVLGIVIFALAAKETSNA